MVLPKVRGHQTEDDTPKGQLPCAIKLAIVCTLYVHGVSLIGLAAVAVVAAAAAAVYRMCLRLMLRPSPQSHSWSAQQRVTQK
jgi:hypothetical protein